MTSGSARRLAAARTQHGAGRHVQNTQRKQDHMHVWGKCMSIHANRQAQAELQVQKGKATPVCLQR
jgi:hypothetical protein